MKTLVKFGFVVALVLTVTSCVKWEKGESKGDYYFAEEYKDAEGSVLGIDAAEITEMYSVFFYEGKNLRYKLVVDDATQDETAECGFGKKESGCSYAAYEEGNAKVDDDLNITFIPDGTGATSYTAYFADAEKGSYLVTLPNLDSREINFVLKK